MMLVTLIIIFIMSTSILQTVIQYFDTFTEYYRSKFNFDHTFELDNIEVSIPKTTGWLVAGQDSKV